MAKKLALCFGVYPVVSGQMQSTDHMMEESVKVAEANGFVKTGDTVVIAAGVPVDKIGATNLLKISVVE